MPRKLNYCIKRPNKPWICLNFTTDIMSFHVACRKKYKVKRGSDYCFAHKGDTSLLDHEASLREVPVFKRSVIKLGPNWTMFLPRHICAMTWHHASFDDFLVSLGFMGTSKPRFKMFEDEPGHRYGCNSFPFLAWDLNMHPRTHVQFF